jgi:hypothetical protein
MTAACRPTSSWPQLACVIAAACVATAACGLADVDPEPGAEEKALTLLYTGAVGGKIEPCG